MQRTHSLEKNPEAGKDWRQEERGMTEDEIVEWITGLEVWTSSRSWWRTGKPGVLQFMGLLRVRLDWVTELNWTCYKENVTIFSVERVTVDFPGGSVVKNLPVQSLGGEEPLEKEKQSTPGFLTGKSHGQRSLAGLAGPSPWSHERVELRNLTTAPILWLIILPACCILGFTLSVIIDSPQIIIYTYENYSSQYRVWLCVFFPVFSKGGKTVICGFSFSKHVCTQWWWESIY